jgi:hypothetical protein
MAWAEGRLWFIRRIRIDDQTVFFLEGVDIAKSTQAGVQHIDSSIDLEGLRTPPLSMAWDGQALLLTGNLNLTRVGLDGKVDARNPYTANWSLVNSKSAHDGSAFWMSHAGPTDFAALPERVSRFHVTW